MYYTDRERAALEWSEPVTLVPRDQVPDEIYERGRRHFSETELINLTLAVTMNRLAIAFRAVPGSYQRQAWAAR